MTELEIYDTILEIDDLLDKALVKVNSKEIKAIAERYNKYYVEHDFFNIRSLGNAILENKVKNTPLQALMISKINDLGLPGDYQQIYNGLPYSIKEQEEYVTTLKNKYELANKCYHLLLEIERLSETETEISYEDMKISEYANLMECQNNLYKNTQNGKQTPEYALAIMKTYLKNLTLEKKQKLYSEVIPLCYNRNVFDYLNQETVIYQCVLSTNMNDNAVRNHYMRYQHLLLTLLLNDLYQEYSLLEIYNSISEVHNSQYIKTLIRKK